MSDKNLERRVIIGRHPVEELITGNIPVEKVFMLQSLKGPFEIKIRKECSSKNIPLIKMQEEPLNRISKSKKHQGIIAISSPVPFIQIEDLIPFLYETKKVPAIVMLDHITDVRNFGAICRSAEIFGLHAVVIPSRGSAAITPEAIKSSSGALFKVPICRVSSIQETVNFLHYSGVQVYTADSRADRYMEHIDFHVPVAVILGAENRGVQKELINMADNSFKIRQSGEIDSLNVSVAAGIIFHEIQRVRG